MSNVKILMIGPSGVGKTTIRKVFFDHENPFEILQTTLEPTRGIETNLYSLGSTIAIHDLAGQQLDYWLDEAQENFVGTDLILFVLDSQDSWKSNIALLQKVLKARGINCPYAEIVVLFHKIDLISAENRFKLKDLIKTYLSEVSLLSAFQTSIERHYYVETFRIFITVLQKYIKHTETQNFKELSLKVEFLNEIFVRESVSVDQLVIKFKEAKSQTIDIIQEMASQDLILFDKETNNISMTENGQMIISNFNREMELKIQKPAAFMENEFIQGIIIADMHGRPFYAFENLSNYFSKMFPENENSVDTIQTLITMFFAAIKDFGESIDKKGIVTVNLTGRATQIISIHYQNIFSILFVENIRIDQSVTNFLKQFIRDVYQDGKNQIDGFIASGNTSLCDPFNFSILPKIKMLEENLKTIHDLNQNLSQDKLYLLYQQIQERDYSKIDENFLKNLIFKHILAESLNVVEEISKDDLNL